MAVWRIGLTLPELFLGEFETLFEDHAVAVSTSLVDDSGEAAELPDRLWRLNAYCADILERDAVTALASETAARLGLVAPEIAIEAIADEDWAAKYAREVSLLFAGRFVVHGDYLHPPPGRIALCINAGNAFGSGMHGSTRGCLLALDRIAATRRVQKALDLGAGSGILAVAIAKCWDGGGMGRADVLAADIDPASVAVSQAVAKANGVAASVRICQSEGFAAHEIGEAAPYDLICANILANPLRQMAPELAHHLAPDGIAILSGLLASQEAEVVETYGDAGLRSVDPIRLGNWSTLLLTY
ncbi:MAG: 50S ribosomal protein L11 methyltransferase [Proteobacteria bacterium]|nr:50S ribosomal protein L11 methyltransferase [Pseudomonadota bacterium]MDA1356599.1 50S ribosomal protein L11 methyltransferase [Pseudomonadota bacterium]